MQTNAGQLISATASAIKSKLAAIFTGYLKLSMLTFPLRAAGVAGYLPNDRRLISPTARFLRVDQRGCLLLFRLDLTHECKSLSCSHRDVRGVLEPSGCHSRLHANASQKNGETCEGLPAWISRPYERLVSPPSVKRIRAGDAFVVLRLPDLCNG